MLLRVIAADVKTHHNRYLMIATSGGLNQQRTGVSLSKLTHSRANPGANICLLKIGVILTVFP